MEPAEAHTACSINKKDPEGTGIAMEDQAEDNDEETIEQQDDQDLDLIRKLMTL